MILAYIRVSSQHQSWERQEINIRKEFPMVEKIYREKFTGTKLDERKEFNRLRNEVRSGDTIVFDEVSRMSRNAKEGADLYFEWFDKGVNLVFLKERHIDTDAYRKAMEAAGVNYSSDGTMVGNLVQDIVNAVNSFMRSKVTDDIVKAFEHAQKEVDYLHRRTREGMEASGAGDKISKARTGKKYVTEKEAKAKAFIKKRNKAFGGDLNNEETWKLAGISKQSFYNYKCEIMNEIAMGQLS